MKIEAYSFGKMIISGRKFKSDLMIFPDGSIRENWRRLRGHNLVPDDIKELLNLRPQNLVIGTGKFGLMKISNDLEKRCQYLGIILEKFSTATAVKRFNELIQGNESAAAGFHLTC